VSQLSEDIAACFKQHKRLREAISTAIVDLAQMEADYRGTKWDAVSDEARKIRRALADATTDAARASE
jgi:hypothetical protein